MRHALLLLLVLCCSCTTRLSSDDPLLDIGQALVDSSKEAIAASTLAAAVMDRELEMQPRISEDAWAQQRLRFVYEPGYGYQQTEITLLIEGVDSPVKDLRIEAINTTTAGEQLRDRRLEEFIAVQMQRRLGY
ncbi:MAG: hypothetical protein ACOCXJ_05375 [Planctomycetota bacterium]